MIAQTLNLIRALFSRVAWEESYERRRRFMRNQNNRTATNVFLVSGILLGLMTFIGGMFFIERDSHSYLKSRNRVTVFDENQQLWEYAGRDACDQANVHCLPFQLESVTNLVKKTPTEIRELTHHPEKVQYIRLRLKVPEASWRPLAEYLTLVFSLPNMKFKRATAFLNGDMQRSFFLSRPVNFPFETKSLAGQDLIVDLLMETSPTEPFALGLSQPTFIATQSEFEKFGDYLTLKKSGRGNWIAVVSRITLALFAIALFLLVDSSPESLGLALFMGFDALGIAAKQGWMPLAWLGPWWDLFAAALFTNMGLVFRLYFYFNIARIMGNTVRKWLAIGALWAFPMAFYAMSSGNKPGSFYNDVFSAASLVVAALGAITCVRTYLYIRRESLHWRHMALLSASVASFPAIMLSLDALFPSFITSGNVIDGIYNAQFNSGFLLALSAFFNISSLENRVKALSLVQIKAKQLEFELELGRSVQQQQMRVPKLPDQISVDYFQSAASYVSGDTFFFNWDEKERVFTVLLNDVTGHGVQAALKATICGVMADLIWSRRVGPRLSVERRSKIAEYNELVCQYFNERFDGGNLHSVSGAEFYADEGRLVFFRSNAPMPIILQPQAEHDANSLKFDVSSLALKNESETTINLKPGAVVIIMSDGIMFSSREQAHLTKLLVEYVRNSASSDLSLEGLKGVIINSHGKEGNKIDDDKTIIIFKWQPRRLGLKTVRSAS